MDYYGEMDQECVVLCDAINRIPGLRTIESCCGHGMHPYRIFYKVENMEKLAVLLYFLEN